MNRMQKPQLTTHHEFKSTYCQKNTKEKTKRKKKTPAYYVTSRPIHKEMHIDMQIRAQAHPSIRPQDACPLTKRVIIKDYLQAILWFQPPRRLWRFWTDFQNCRLR
uniref:Phosphoinositide phosphatase SAC8 isoform X3 n=1 Tax=Rhizophora mucronata TaxID=61149 RepID=A0A2P2LJ39_RHIMU